MAAFNPGMPNDDTGVVGRFEQAKELQRARLAGYASGVPYDANAPVGTGGNPALRAPQPPLMGAPQPVQPQQEATPMAEGRLVTKPTLAILGEKPGEAEMVVPLNNNPDNRVPMSMLSPISRYRR